MIGGNVLSPGQAAQILFGIFFLLLALRVPVAVALGLACLPILLAEPRLSSRAEAKVELLSGAFVVLFALVFLWWGWEFTEFAVYRISELAELPLWTIHVAWPIAGAVWLLFQAERMADAVLVLRGGSPAA